MPYVNVAENATCSVDRSTLALHYSSNLVDWIKAGFVDYTLAYHRHFANPDMLVDGDDLLVVSEASMGGERVHPCALLQNFGPFVYLINIFFCAFYLQNLSVCSICAACWNKHQHLPHCAHVAQLLGSQCFFLPKANGLLAHTTRTDCCDQMHKCRQLCDDSRSSAVVKSPCVQPMPPDTGPAVSETSVVCRFYNNANSNAIVFHRVRGFRTFARQRWSHHSEPYAQGPNKVFARLP